MRKQWLLLLAAAAVALSAALVDATVSAARMVDVPTTTNVYAWIGLKNSDDVGTKFEVKAEVTNGTSEGYSAPVQVPAGSSGFNNAKLVTIPVTNYVGTVGDPISITIWVRVACASGHVSGTARLWWNDTQANSRVNESPGFGTRSLKGAETLSDTVGSGPKMTKDVLVKKTGCPGQADDANWKTFGTWTLGPPPNLHLSPGGFAGTQPNGANVYLFTTFGPGQTVTFTVTNDGGTSNALTLSGATAQFVLSDNTCGPALGPGGTCSFKLTFTPPAGCSGDFQTHVLVNGNPSGAYIDLFLHGDCPV
jgi:hypothetical protein